ncbi:MAG: hypothetical protein J6W52_02665 [Bacteroidaceae bacterium]|nr:hypothetical protein [Bacteroidaceae bacterium]
MTQAQQAFDFNPTVKDAADRMMQCIDKFEINVAEDYLGENNKMQQYIAEVNSSAQLTTDAQTLGLQPALAQLNEKVTLLRDLLTQRGMAKAPKGQMKAARAAMEPEYRWLIAVLNAYAIVDDNPQRFATLVAALNSNIDYLRVHALKDGGETAGQGGNSENNENQNQNNGNNNNNQNDNENNNNNNNTNNNNGNDNPDNGNNGNDNPDNGDNGNDNPNPNPGGDEPIED